MFCSYFCSILAWGADEPSSGFGDSGGFGNEEEGFDSFLAMEAPPPEQVIYTHNAYIIKRRSILFLDLRFQVSRNDSHDSDEAGTFNVVIRPREVDPNGVQPTPFIAPPPRPENTYIYNGMSIKRNFLSDS